MNTKTEKYVLFKDFRARSWRLAREKAFAKLIEGPEGHWYKHVFTGTYMEAAAREKILYNWQKNEDRLKPPLINKKR